MIATNVFRTIRDSVCAVAVGTSKLWNYAEGEQKPDGVNFQILGTGFLITRDLVLTNRHVFNAIRKFDQNWIALLFIRADDSESIDFVLHKIDKRMVLTSSSTWSETEGWTLGTDIALLQLNPNNIESVSQYHKPVIFAEKECIQISTPIGVCGYIYGNKLFGNPQDVTTIRFAPLLLQGHIAGLAPYDNLPNQKINLILTDMTNGGGLSGSPVFMEDGRVVGVHCAGHTELVFGPSSSPDQPPEVKLITQGIGFAVPIWRDYIEKLMLAWGEAISGAEAMEKVNDSPDAQH